MKDLNAQLKQLESAQLVRRIGEEEATYIFKHALTQDASYQSLLQKQRREIHRHVAHAYEAEYDNTCLDDYAGILANHYTQAGDDQQAIIYATRAGDVAARIYANAEAIAHYSLALSATARINAPSMVVQALYLKRGRAFELLSHFDDAARNYDEMQETAHQRGDRAFELAALIARATIRAIPSSAQNADQARALANQALSLARELNDRKAEAKIFWVLLVSNVFSSGDNEEAIAYGEKSLAIARELNLTEQMAFSLNDLLVAYSYRGDLDKARQVRLEAAELWRRLDNQPMLAECITGIGLIHYLLGDYHQATTIVRESYQIGQKIGNLGSQGYSGLVFTLCYIQLGEFANALRSLAEAIPMIDYGGLEGNGISLQGLLAWVYACVGDMARAREFMREAFNRHSIELPYQRLYLCAIRARVELLAGNVTEAERITNENNVIANAGQFERMFPPSAHFVYLADAELALAHDDYDRALTLLNELLELLEKRRTRADGALVLYRKGQALAGANRHDEASEVWLQALAEAEATRERNALWQICGTLNEMETARGNVKQANAYRKQARQVLEFITAHLPEEFRESFLNLPNVRAVMDTE